MQPSCRKARRFKALSGQPILANSMTYHAFRVSFQVALDATTNTGQRETTQPTHRIQGFPLFISNGTSMVLMYILPFASWAGDAPCPMIYSPLGGFLEALFPGTAGICVRCPRVAASP